MDSKDPTNQAGEQLGLTFNDEETVHPSWLALEPPTLSTTDAGDYQDSADEGGTYSGGSNDETDKVAITKAMVPPPRCNSILNESFVTDRDWKQPQNTTIQDCFSVPVNLKPETFIPTNEVVAQMLGEIKNFVSVEDFIRKHGQKPSSKQPAEESGEEDEQDMHDMLDDEREMQGGGFSEPLKGTT